MLLFAATALASANVGNLAWPCTRLNWAWRNVWSTCSINSYVPTNGAGAAEHPPAHFRKAPINDNLGPTAWLQVTANHIVPFGAEPAGASNVNTAVPAAFCTALTSTAGNTGAGFQFLRNRCRRAIDAYGGIVQTCQLPPHLTTRGPVTNSLYTNFQPLAEQHPHSHNVAALASHARRCHTTVHPGTTWSPATTCPGLLGWWSVVWNVCGFRTYVPNSGAVAEADAGPRVAPLGGSLNFPYLNHNDATGISTGAPDAAIAPNFAFCSPNTPNLGGANTPRGWNTRGPVFRSTRCRKALDQFGRTATRCGGTDVPSAAAAPVRGSADHLRTLFNGVSAANAPNNLRMVVPLCN